MLGDWESHTLQKAIDADLDEVMRDTTQYGNQVERSQPAAAARGKVAVEGEDGNSKGDDEAWDDDSHRGEDHLNR